MERRRRSLQRLDEANQAAAEATRRAADAAQKLRRDEDAVRDASAVQAFFLTAVEAPDALSPDSHLLADRWRLRPAAPPGEGGEGSVPTSTNVSPVGQRRNFDAASALSELRSRMIEQGRPAAPEPEPGLEPELEVHAEEDSDGGVF